MKRSEGFDEGDARQDAPAEAAEAPRQRRGPSKPRLPFRGRVADDREARPASDESAAAVETPAPTTPGSTPAPGASGTRPPAVGAPPSVGARRPSSTERVREFLAGSVALHLTRHQHRPVIVVPVAVVDWKAPAPW